MMGSEVATGKVAQLWTVLATLVPSTSTCRTVRCSLSVATITTESSGIAVTSPTTQVSNLGFNFDLILVSNPQCNYFPEGLALPLDPSNLSSLIKGCGFLGPGGVCVLGEMRCTVQRTINSELLFCALLLLKKLPRIGMSPRPGPLFQISVTRLSIRPAMTKLCPSINSNSVSALRVLKAGTVKPEMVSAFEKSRVLTSGATVRWILPLGMITGVKSSFTPN